MGYVADTIWRQIPVMTRMSVGARKPIGGETSIVFKVLNGTRWINVRLDPCDTYTVTFFRKKRVTREEIIIHEESDIYNSDLADTIYRMTHQRETS